MHKTLIAFAALAALPVLAHAADSSSFDATTSISYELSAEQNGQTFTIRDSAYESYARQPVSVSASGPEANQAFWNARFESGAGAETGRVAAQSHAVWQAPAVPGLRSNGATSWSSASNQEERSFGERGRIRFVVDYTLGAAGEGASSHIEFNASSFFVDDTTHDVPVVDSFHSILSRTVGGRDGPSVISDSWNSGWLYFDEQNALDEAWGYHWYNTLYTSLRAWTSLTPYDPDYQRYPVENGGDWRSFAAASVRYEIEPWSGVIPTPVPEPETYALTAAGLAALGLARRLRRG